jgi:hypothetical protein
MPVAYVQEFDTGGDRSTTNYDAIAGRLNAQGVPEGAIFHTAGFTEDGRFRIFDVWESKEHLQRFLQERLMPIVQEVTAGQDVPQPREETYELHDFIKA